MPPMSPPRAPAISVVVPFFDSERYIAACVESLLGQEDVDGSFEIILVDNGSRDGSARILARYSALTVLEEPTPGAYAARNAGIRRARAPIVAFTDADCIADRHWLRAVARGMQDPTVAILIGRCVYPEDARFSLRLLAAYENAKAAYVVERCAPRYQFAYANNMAVRASVFAEVGQFKAWKRAGDAELVHRVRNKRPDLRLAYRHSMLVTHMEFRRTRDRLRRLSVYTKTNSRIETFSELGIGQRLGLLFHWMGSRWRDPEPE
jgi:glycosyltransferase involved in cell wall biosynthesis